MELQKCPHLLLINLSILILQASEAYITVSSTHIFRSRSRAIPNRVVCETQADGVPKMYLKFQKLLEKHADHILHGQKITTPKQEVPNNTVANEAGRWQPTHQPISKALNLTGGNKALTLDSARQFHHSSNSF
jgi:hypothetical protein